MGKQIGKKSVEFTNRPCIVAAASIAGQKEGEGKYGSFFDVVEEDPMFGADSWEEAESKMQHQATEFCLRKAGMDSTDVRYLVAGDLLGQLIATSFGIMNFNIPMFGVYGACSTMGESLAIASILVDGGYGDFVMALTSSHFASAEKQFRFPLTYGSQRPYSATWTVTGSGAVLLGSPMAKWCHLNNKTVTVVGITTGCITDYGIKDSMNMGACMAPAAVDAILSNFKDFQIGPNYYDQIFTGDLGTIGSHILVEMLKGYGYDVSGVHTDLGEEIFKKGNDEKDVLWPHKNKKSNTIYIEENMTHMDNDVVGAGGSGCGCAAIMLCGYILKRMEEGSFRRVLFVPTGALLSPVSFNEGRSVPGVAHAIMLERKE